MESILTLPTSASKTLTSAESKARARREKPQAPPLEERALTYQLRDGQYDPFAPLQASTLQAGMTFEF